MKTLLSLFDFTGAVTLPYVEAGWDVIQVDLQHGIDVMDLGQAELMDLTGGETVSHVIAQPPCTDFTLSGAQYWDAKDADGRTERSVELVRQTLRIIEFLRPDVWWLENPDGRIGRLIPEIGPIRDRVDPWRFAGWTDPSRADIAALHVTREKAARAAWSEITREEIDLTRRTNAYTKATNLYGMFRPPERRPLFPVSVCSQGSWMMLLGGKSDRTKNLRSATPAGFARAIFEANRDVELDWDAIDEGTASYPFDFENPHGMLF